MVKTNKEKKMERKLNSLLIFLIPIWYTLKTRFIKRSSKGFLFWASEYLVPVLIVLWCIDTACFHGINAFLAILCTYCFYELGYIQNDCETIKKEKNPTLRLNEKELAFYEKHKIIIYAVRFFYIAAFTVYYNYLGISKSILILLFAVLPYYIIYNTVRGKICDYLINPLTAYRYCMPLILYQFSAINWTALLYILLAYSFPTFLQYCVREKNGKPSKLVTAIIGKYEDRDIFRVKYYSVFLIASFVATYLNYLEANYLVLAIYFLVFRIATLKYRLKLKS